jgi:hypothetical protein
MRPDGYLAWARGDGSLDQLGRALATWFGDQAAITA